MKNGSGFQTFWGVLGVRRHTGNMVMPYAIFFFFFQNWEGRLKMFCFLAQRLDVSDFLPFAADMQ
jgi:hypothetical protein